jgi:hypothetical protein
MSDKEKDILSRFGNYILNNNCTVEFLVELIELELDVLNADTISNFAKKHGKSYPWIVKTKRIIPIHGVKFAIDPD